VSAIGKLVQSILIVALGLAGLAYAAPALIALIHALVPLALVVGAVVAVLWLVRYFTRS
jgi:hypothetical protein